MRRAANGSGSGLENAAGMKKRLVEMGADVVGVADMTLYDREILGFGEDIGQAYPRAISFGLLVPKGVLETLTDGPTLFYLHHYRQVNYRLDTIAYLLAKEIEAARPPGPAVRRIADDRLAASVGTRLAQARGRCSRGRMDRAGTTSSSTRASAAG